MRGTKESGQAQYGAANTLYPGRRLKNQSYDTSVGGTALTTTNPTINAARTLIDTAVKAARVVTRRAIGLASTSEAGGAALTLQIVSGGSAYSFTSPATAVATTGGNGSGLTVTYTRTTGAVATATVVVGGRGYTVGDLITSTLAGGTGLSVRITSVR
jgi:hypothetical protein